MKAPPSLPQATREQLQALLDGSDFTREYGMEVRELEIGRCTVEMPFREHYVRPGGVIPGFIYMTAADVTMWLAIFTLLGERATLSVTTDMRTSFLAGLVGAPFLCRAHVIDDGEQLLFGTADCVDLTGRVLTHHALTYIHPPA